MTFFFVCTFTVVSFFHGIVATGHTGLLEVCVGSLACLSSYNEVGMYVSDPQEEVIVEARRNWRDYGG
jgi:hypothetical protein